MIINVYYGFTENLKDEYVYKQKLEEIWEERRKKIDNFKVLSARQDSLGAALLLKKAFEDIGIEKNRLKNPHFLYGENGKPTIYGMDDVRFNISHSNGALMCVVATDVVSGGLQVGCDVEQDKKIQQSIKVAKRFFTQKEYEDVLENNQNFYRYWTLKESFLKMTGRGLSVDLGSFEFDISSTQPRISQGLYNGSLLFREYEGIEDMAKNFRYAVCVGDEYEKQELHLPETMKYLDL